jgi:hypothetical protein
MTPLLLLSVFALGLQTPSTSAPPRPPVEKLGEGLFRVGAIRVDTSKREIAVPGSVNQVQVLEFLANTKGGAKAYESALTLDTDAISFNVALLLIGLDPARATKPQRHFDPAPVRGDPVEITIEWKDAEKRVTRASIDRLLWDRAANRAPIEGGWVYTGSTGLPDGRLMAELDGVLIGFVHSPSPILENSGGAGIGNYGSIVINPQLKLEPDTPVTLTVKALARSGGDRK